MLTADAQLDARTRRAAALGGDADQVADAFLVEADEGVLLEDALVDIGVQEPAGVVAADAEGGLGQVVGAEGEELGMLGQVAGADGRALADDLRSGKLPTGISLGGSLDTAA